MIKRLSALVLAIAILFSLQTVGFACNESQSNTYITQILFGNSALSRANDENVKLLLNAVYLCCEQSDNLGQDKLDFLRRKRVAGASSLSSINIKGELLQECSHNSWEHEVESIKRNQANRRRLLQNSVNKVFDFGLFNNWFGSGGGKCNSFAAFLYYSHILSDNLADDPAETEVTVRGKTVPAYPVKDIKGNFVGYVEINGNKPSFTWTEKNSTESSIELGALDDLGRCGAVYAVLGWDSMNFVGPRPDDLRLPTPVGWKQSEYPGVVNTTQLYNRCHLIARSLCGIDNLHNLITGTRYMNETMGLFETKVADYIREHKANHVLYRVTPIYQRDNLLASGVQMEAYSVEDSGKGVSFNVYCYNVQPGIDLDYENGGNNLSDLMYGNHSVLPFATPNATATNPDLIFEINKHLEILFKDQNKSATYTTMMNKIKSIADEARAVSMNGDTEANKFAATKTCEYEFFDVLKSYVPLLLEKESFFTSAFK